MKRFTIFLFCGLLAFGSVAGDRLNIIMIMADDLGYETIEANGGTSYKTPELNRLASQGLRFEQCYSQPICTPSRNQIMTGQYNIRNYRSFGYLDVKQTTFAQVLKKNGYATCIAGKWQLNGGKAGGDVPGLTRAKHFGFDEWCLWQTIDSGRTQVDGNRVDARYVNPILNVNGKMSDMLMDQYGPDLCAKFITDFISKKKNQPFLIYYPMILTHCPFWPTPDSKVWADPKKRMPGHAYKGDPEFFGDMVSYMDKIVGKIVQHVDDLGLGDNTLIMFTGDNGTDKPIKSMCNGVEIAGDKGSMRDGGTHVPFIVRWPGGGGKAGRVSQDLVNFSDMFPTMLEASHTSKPDGLILDGRSFLPQIQGKTGNPRQWSYCWYSRSGTNKSQVFARTQRYKLYRTGKLYDIKNDRLEKSHLSGELDAEASAARKLLQTALAQFSDITHPADRAKTKGKKTKK